MSQAALPQTVQDYVDAFVWRRRRLALAASIAAAIGFGLLWLVVVGLVDRLLHLPAGCRAIALGINGLAVLAILYRPVRAMLRARASPIEAARQIERRTGAFDQELLTVASQLLGNPEHRGSEQILQRLTMDVERRLVRKRPEMLLPPGPMFRAWLIAVAIALMVVGLCMIPWLNLPRLMARQVAPWADIPPVSTTILSVEPGDVSLVQGQPLTIRVHAQRLSRKPVMLRHSTGAAPAVVPMLSEDQTRFTYTFDSLDRDLKYQVTGGDATSRVHWVRVHPRPAVREFRMEYTYPQYIGRPPLQVANTDGLIEAPLGSVVDVSIMATVPLQSATLQVNDRTLQSSPTIDPLVRAARIGVDRDGVWRLTMVDAAGIIGHGVGDMTIRAIPDRPPLVRVLLPDTDFRLHPRDSIEIPYRAMDDYGVKALQAELRINGELRKSVDLPIESNGRLVEDLLKLDLGGMGMSLGDVLAVRFSATDGAGQTTTTEDIRVLAAVRSVDAHAARRASELRDAYLLADRLVGELESALKLLDDAGLGSEASRQIAAMPAVASAAQVAGLMSRPMLRAIVHSQSPPMSDALAQWIDQSHLMAHRLERHDDDLEEPHGVRRDRLARHLERARNLRGRLDTLWKAQRAAAVLADRDNLASVPEPSAAISRSASQAMEQTRRSAAEGARQLQLDPQAADLDEKLKAMVEAGASAVDGARMVDFPELARRWANEPTGDNALYDERLAIASQAEAVRPDSNLLRARDLNLVARAVRRIDSLDRATTRPADTRARVPDAVQALARQHALARQKDKPDARRQAEIVARADEARRLLRTWAAEDEPPRLAAVPRALGDDPADESPAIEPDQQRLAAALEASAQAQQGNYDAAEAIDRQSDQALANEDAPRQDPTAAQRPSVASALGDASPGPMDRTATQASPTPADAPTLDRRPPESDSVPPHIRRRQQAMRTARALDELRAEQAQLREQTRNATPEQAQSLAERQQALAQRIEELHQHLAPASDEQPPPTRQQALDAIRQAQQRLTSMPQELSQAQRTQQAADQARQRLQAAREELEAATDENRPAARRVQGEAQRQADQAEQAAQRDLQAAGSDTAGELADALRPFSPETLGAVEALSNRLQPALRSMEQSAQAQDIVAFNRGAEQARQAIAAAQEQLRNAQRELMAQDPLFTARAYAAQAAVELSRQPPDTRAAMNEQAHAGEALGRAWDDSIQQAASARMQGLPTMSWLFSLASGESMGEASGSVAERSLPAATVRQWGRIREQQTSDLSVGAREPDPPGYEEALRVYFQALGRGSATPRAQEGD